MSKVLNLTIELCQRASVTPADAGCQALLAERLTKLDFNIEYLNAGGIINMWATHGGGGKVTAFLGHTDVVPSGPEHAWSSAPFVPVERDGLLFARGSADMKASVAAMCIALEQFVSAHPKHAGKVGLLLTSDEEGDAKFGIKHVAQVFAERGEALDYCLVGEPSSNKVLGDVIRVGRRGSLGAKIIVRGVQGHVAYPEKALNPIHAFAPALAELAAIAWDQGNHSFPPTSFQVSNIESGTGASNVIPGELSAWCNFRFGTASRAQDLQKRVEQIFNNHKLNVEITWDLSGAPFLTEPGELRTAVVAAVREVLKIETEQTTGGGTSDGRFIAPLGTQVVELGHINASIHQVDEHVRIADLEPMREVYLRVLEKLHGGS